MEGTSGFCGTRVENHCNGVKREKRYSKDEGEEETQKKMQFIVKLLRDGDTCSKIQSSVGF